MVRHSSTDGKDIDPATEDIVTAAKRKPRRNVPAPHKANLQDKSAARSRAEARAPSPGIMLEDQGQDKGWLLTSPHSDLDLWYLQLADAFGTRSQSVIGQFIEDLRSLVPEAWDEGSQKWKPDETALNAALAMVADIRPANSMEAAHAAQMVAVHRMQMQLTKSAMNGGGAPMEKEMAIAARLARTFSKQWETLAKMRGQVKPIEQNITVTKEIHSHAHYHDHRGGAEKGGQPDATKRAVQSPAIPSLPSADEAGQVVPFASGKR